MHVDGSRPRSVRVSRIDGLHRMQCVRCVAVRHVASFLPNTARRSRTAIHGNATPPV